MTSVTDAVPRPAKAGPRPADAGPRPADAGPRPADAVPNPAKERRLLPTKTPLALLAPDGQPVHSTDLDMPGDDVLVRLHRQMVLGLRFDSQATALTKQGRLAVYPSARGQEAGEIGAVAALRPQDWLFPTYRDSMALVARGVDPVEVLTLLRGDWHCGYDPYEHRVAPQCTPLATNAPHAVGVAHAARLKGEDTVALVMLGDGATSEGDTHTALNFAAVWNSPVVFFVQNNGYAISVPVAKQTAAPSLAHKGIGYGIPGVLVDGNDPAAVYAAVRQAVESAAGGGGPTLIEALTYRDRSPHQRRRRRPLPAPGRGAHLARPRPGRADQAVSPRPGPAGRRRPVRPGR